MENMVGVTMNILGSLHINGAGIAAGWLRNALSRTGVSVPITEASLREFAADASAAAHGRSMEGSDRGHYSDHLRDEIEKRADFLRAWVGSDDRFDEPDPVTERWVRIARNHSLPRAWKLSEPEVRISAHPTPTYLYWASAS